MKKEEGHLKVESGVLEGKLEEELCVKICLSHVKFSGFNFGIWICMSGSRGSLTVMTESAEGVQQIEAKKEPERDETNPKEASQGSF